MIAAYYAGAYGTAQADAEALDGTNAMSGAELALWTARIGMAAADGDSSEPYRDALNRLSPLQDEDSGLEAEQRPLLFELLARAHLGSGSPDAALGFIDQALAAGETPTRHLIRGLIFEAQDEPEAARQEYDWVLSWDAIAPVAAADQAAERLRALND
jgi:Tfp pilus assembly protein PilF